jgi:uncharacterized protein YciI
MPRDGLSQYAPPPGTNGITNYTIESTKYNGFVADVTQDLNLPRPIAVGGTGATNAHDALINLHGEIANQVVDNYDSFPFAPGSFWSAAGATAAPNANVFTGICYWYGNSADWLVLEAREVLAPGSGVGHLFVRQKLGGTWTAWALQAGSTADLDAAYVNVTGDTMTGALAVNAAVTSAATPTTGTYYFGNSGTKYLNYDGTNFNLTGAPLIGSSAIYANGPLWSITAAATGILYFGNSGAKYLNFDSNNFNLVGGPLYVSSLHIQYGTCYIANGSNSGFINLGDGSAGTGYIAYNGTKFNLGPGPVTVDNTTASTSPTTGALTVAGGAGIAGDITGGGNITAVASVTAGAISHFNGDINVRDGSNTADGIIYFAAVAQGYSKYLRFLNAAGNFEFGGGYLKGGTGYACRSGYLGSYTGSQFNLQYNAGPVALWIDSSNVGNISVTSDYRIKKDVIDLPGMWDTVKKLRPIKYTQADFTPPAHIDFVATQKAEGKEVTEGPMFAADDKERWGFVAHELQETLIEDAATGTKDSYDHVQSPNPFTVIAALTKALQEAMTRIEALEAAP